MENKNFLKGFLFGVSTCFLGICVFAFVMSSVGKLDLSQISKGSRSHAALRQSISNKADILELYINEYFLDEIDEETMENSIYKGIINGLGDDYAAYYTEEEYKEITEKTDGVYCGIGAYLSADTKSGIITIAKPMKNSPAQKAGIQAGDILFAVDGKEITGEEISKVQALVKGEEGTEVTLTVVRNEKKKEIKVVRDKIEENTVFYQVLDNKIGYIQVSGFESVTSKQFQEALQKLEKKGIKALMIDLRNNGGGLLDVAVEMLDDILPEGLVVYSQDKNGQKQEYFAKDKDCFEKPLAILVNGNSASASEVFAGAIQDKKTGVLIGTNTFGKGIVQGIYGLGDGSAIKMTTAKYYTPAGRNIHGKGLAPDVKVELSEQEEELPITKKKTDNQIKAAYDYLIDKVSK